MCAQPFMTGFLSCLALVFAAAVALGAWAWVDSLKKAEQYKAPAGDGERDGIV